MRIREPFKSTGDAFQLPRVIQLEPNLYGCAFFLMKMLPARFIFDRAAEKGLVKPGSVVIETTSGTFGLALAIEGAVRGYRVMLVSDPAIEPSFERRLRDLGAEVLIVREPAPVGGFQRARLIRMAQLQAQHPDHFWPSQYANEHNPGGYGPLAELLAESVGTVDTLVGTVGSGGSMCGTSRFLRVAQGELRSIGVDTHGSVLFGQPDSKRMLRGLGNSLMPKTLDHSTFDEVHWVSAAEAFHATRQLHRQYGLFMGGTSGAAYMVARAHARAHPERKVVALFPDEGHRYQDTVYSDDWLRANHLFLESLPSAPVHVEHPRHASGVWARFDWNRRTYEQVMGAPFVEGQSR